MEFQIKIKNIELPESIYSLFFYTSLKPELKDAITPINYNKGNWDTYKNAVIKTDNTL